MPVIDGRGTRPVVQSGDLAFLQQKEQEGKLKSAEGTLTSAGDLASITAGTNRDLYLASAKLNARNTDLTNAQQTLTVVLKLNDVIIDTWSPSRVLFGGGAGSAWHENNYEFVVGIGQKVSAGEIIKLEVTSASSGWTINGALQAWEESSGSQQFGGNTVTFQSDGGDIAFLRNRSREDNLVIVTANLNNATGEILNFIPPIGKTFFLYKAGITSNTTPSSNTNKQCRVEVRNDGNVVDYLAGSSFIDNLGAGGGANIAKTETTIMGDKLIGDGIKKYSMQAQVNGLACFATLTGWLEDT